jgi:hypothetical protein
MQQQAMTQPVTPTSHQQVETLPCWDKLPPGRRQAVIIALTTMMVKWLPAQRRPQEGEDE